MKHWIAIMAAAVLMPLGNAAYASPPTGPPGPEPAVTAPSIAPLIALQERFAQGAGVRFRETVTTTAKPKRGAASASTLKMSGVVNLGRTGVSSADVTLASYFTKNDAVTIRTVLVGGTAYFGGSALNELYIGDAEWISLPTRLIPPDYWSQGPVVLFRPEMLKTLLAKAKFDKESNSFSGTIALGTVLAPGSAIKVKPRDLKAKVNWKLWLGKDNLPKRLTTSTTLIDGTGRLITHGDTRFQSWGTSIDITKPPAHLVVPGNEREGLPRLSIPFSRP
ncbi:hypothetical protein [Rhizohabitans arisaemae]|uniref:hypothetical protein n=1 Tax=Rhizohabitans arisaemae TaxID=2720610 RepID=UPI0024B21317|nr:hypothetical protein [Rhizohabitans arisaemae]